MGVRIRARKRVVDERRRAFIHPPFGQKGEGGDGGEDDDEKAGKSTEAQPDTRLSLTEVQCACK